MYSTNLDSTTLVFNNLEFNNPWNQQTLIQQPFDSTILKSTILGFNNLEINNSWIQHIFLEYAYTGPLGKISLPLNFDIILFLIVFIYLHIFFYFLNSTELLRFLYIIIILVKYIFCLIYFPWEEEDDIKVTRVPS